jgi:hypothetical protein
MKDKVSTWADLVESLNEKDRERGFRMGAAEIYGLFVEASRDPNPDSRAERIEALLVEYPAYRPSYPKPIRD